MIEIRRLPNGRWAVVQRGYIKFCGTRKQCEMWRDAIVLQNTSREYQDKCLGRAIYR